MDDPEDGVLRDALDDLQLDQAVGQHAGRPGGQTLRDGAAGRGDDDGLGLAVEDRLGPGAGLVVQGGVAAADISHGAGGEPALVGDLAIGVARVGVQQELESQRWRRFSGAASC